MHSMCLSITVLLFFVLIQKKKRKKEKVRFSRKWSFRDERTCTENISLCVSAAGSASSNAWRARCIKMPQSKIKDWYAEKYIEQKHKWNTFLLEKKKNRFPPHYQQLAWFCFPFIAVTSSCVMLLVVLTPSQSAAGINLCSSPGDDPY